MKQILLSACLYCLSIAPGSAQKNDYLWPLGQGPKYSEFRFFFNFNTDPPSILLRSDTMSTGSFGGSYSNDMGEIVAYTNGLRILNKNSQLIENAFGLNPTLTQGQTQGSYGGKRSGFFLADPGNPDILYFLHIDYGYHPANGWPYRYVGRNLMVTTLDMSANSGKGKAIAKNEILMSGVLMIPAAVRHANGRDWWILVSDADENRHYRFLLTPEGFLGPDTQAIGTKPSPIGKNNSGAGNSFSPNGRYYIDNNSFVGFSVFDFDRCTGLLGNERRVEWPEPVPPDFELQSQPGFGNVFSPDERLLYVTATYSISKFAGWPKGSIPYLFQFDLTAPDLAASIDTLSTTDTLRYYPYAVNYDVMWGAQLAPDGRIYAVHRGDSYCTVHYPNIRGKGCKFVYDNPDFHDVIGECMPVFPNYRLGPLDGSPCDTLGLNNLPVANFRVEDTLSPLTRFFYDLSYHEPATWSWSFGDGATSTDTLPTHEYAEAGKYHVCLTVSNANGSDTYCRDLFIGITGQQDVEAAEPDWWLSPNPAREAARVVFRPGAVPASGLLTVSDTYGRVVYRRALAYTGSGVVDLAVRDWPAGLYFVTVEGLPGRRKTCRLVVAP